MRSTAAQAARVVKLEQPARPGGRGGGAVLLPPILSVDKWSAIAERQQAALTAATRADEGEAAAARVVAAPDRPYWHKS